jgi:hypothetical protein
LVNPFVGRDLDCVHKCRALEGARSTILHGFLESHNANRQKHIHVAFSQFLPKLDEVRSPKCINRMPKTIIGLGSVNDSHVILSVR